MTGKYDFVVNGRPVSVATDSAAPLLSVLRDELNLRGSKFGCGTEQCGVCMVLIDGKPEYSCSREIATVAGRSVTTIEGLADGDTLHPVQQAWIDEDVAQCGFCQPGQIMAAAALLAENPHPTDADIDALDNVCRCGTYVRIRAAIHRAAGS